ncbi:hypothetical protein CR105_13550 [Massilia eurypsychrophila]|uniref:Uncharacterized protein n=2 Tax=Massilia eurypsychrophila TaxID=1485217 RepID=A0A2G8TEV8_9BURK|nr:hypothetical protein CR105_13550 [Massilia eurypsychrophila]
MSISELERTHAWWRYLWPFRSRRTQLQTLALLAAEVCIMLAAVYALNPSPSLAPVLLAAPLILLSGAQFLLPARLVMATQDDACHAVTDLQARLLKLGYVRSEQPMPQGSFRYRHKYPRWLQWGEQDVELLVHGHELVLDGPMAVLYGLRAEMLLPDERNRKA